MFYLLNGKTISSWVKSVEGEEIIIGKQICSKCKGEKNTYNDKVKINVIGKRIVDLYDNFFFPIVSEKFKSVIEENNLTGVKFIEVEVIQYLDGSRKPMDIKQRLFRMIITGRTGMWRNSNGEILLHCEECKRVSPKNNRGLTGYSTLEEEWDGSNFFMYSNQSRLMIIDEVAYKVLKKAKLKNIEIKQLEKCREF